MTDIIDARFLESETLITAMDRRAATLYVCSQADDSKDAKFLLDVLGLLAWKEELRND